ncbi:hypothetical protein BD311DRAFT_786276 [Dichomitus squalens]|uniref:Uncharacterized protein n=1 Tax=Dichomitus squalens TaxID=114155 RepID=A0A4V2K193_9APHY|nr:hypothetical protein BD311DRAFT_786276 [Dichomitus squalens]
MHQPSERPQASLIHISPESSVRTDNHLRVVQQIQPKSTTARFVSQRRPFRASFAVGASRCLNTVGGSPTRYSHVQEHCAILNEQQRTRTFRFLKDSPHSNALFRAYSQLAATIQT